MNSIICKNCGSSNFTNIDQSKICEYCGSYLFLESNKTTNPNNYLINQDLEKIINLFFDSIEYGFLDEDLFVLTMENLFMILTPNNVNHIKKKINYGIISYNYNFDFINQTLELIKSIRTKQNNSLNDYILDFISFSLVEKFKIDFIKDIKNEYDYYLDDRFKNINDAAFKKKQTQVISDYSTKQKELENYLTIINSIKTETK